MKNPLIKSRSNGLIVALFAATALAAGTLTWLYYKKGNAELKAVQPGSPHLRNKKDKKKSRTDIRELHTIIPSAHE